jgi:gliding motility-associated-like protein
MDVAVKTGATVNAFGPVSFINTPVTPVTQVTASYCGTQLTDLDGAVRADALPLATVYRFRIKQGSNEQVIEETVPQTLLYKTTFYAYNTTYTVDVSANVAGTWTAYGAACDVTTLRAPVTQVSLIDCGKILTTNDAQIHADHVPTATAYRFRMTVNGQTDSLDQPTNFARLGAMPSYEFNTTYSVRVSALVNGAWTPYGAACNVTTPVLVPQISTEMCGTVLSTVYGEIHEDLIPATMFSFIITDGTHIDTLKSQVGSIRLSSVPFYNYNTVFTVRVAVLRNGVWSPYGPACSVTTTNAVLVTKVEGGYCGKVLTTNDGEIRADDLPLATAYKFKVTDGTNTDSLTSSTSFVRLAALSFFAFNTTYSIQVSAMINGVWTGYGAACSVTTPAPLTQVSASYCGTVLPTWNAQIQADGVAFASAYQFRVTQGSIVQTVLSATNNLRLSELSSFAFNTPFTIDVAAKEGNALGAYGTACVVTTPAALTNANLSTLTLSAGTLTPVFDAGTLAYTASVNNATTAITLTPRVADATATVKINGTAVISGSHSGSIALDIGPNLITTEVTAQDSTTTKSYTTTVTRAKATQTITFNNLSAKIYGAVDFDPGATSNNAGIPVTYTSSDLTVATIVDGEIHIIGAGTSTITASQASDATHLAATDVHHILTVNQKSITVSATAASKNYGEADPTFAYTTDVPLIGTDTFTGSLTRDPGENVNSYAITQGTLALNSNYNLTYTGANLTIGQKAITVSAKAASKNYGEADPTFAYTTDVPLIGTDAFTGALTRDPGETVNSYAITQGTLALNSNYNLTYTGANLTIGQKAITVTATAASKNYGEADPTFAYTTDVPLIGTDAFTGALTRDPGENVNSYAITQGTLALNSNYNLTYSGANLTIGQKAITVSATAASKNYGEADPTFAYTTDVPLIGTDAFTGSLTRDPGENVASYAINQGTLALSSNYNLRYTGASLTVGQRVITVTVNSQTKTYGDTNPVLTYSFRPSLITGDSFSGNLSRELGEKIGSYAINQGTLALNTNYTLNYTAADLVINKKTITVTANAQSKTYGNVDPELTYSFSPALISGDSFTGILNRAPGERTGTYAIDQGTLTLSTNYILNYAGAALTIAYKTLTIAVDDQSKVYGSANPVLSVSYSGFVNGDSQSNITTQPVISTTATSAAGAGSYTIIASGAVVPGYTVNYVDGTLTINKAPLKVTADSKSRNYGAANPALTVSYSGFVNGDSQSNLTTQATATTTATTNSAPGSTTITAGGASSANYRVSYLNGTLTIIPLTNANMAKLSISLGALSPPFVTGTFDYTAQEKYAVSSITLTPNFDATATTTINGTPVPNGSPSYGIPLNTGNNTITTVVTAQDGVTKNTYTLTVYRAIPPAAIVPTNILSPNGDGKNDTWVIKDIQLYPNNTVTIYDKAGRVIYTKHGYNNDWDGTLRGAPLAQGTYYYIVDLGAGVLSLKGFITMLKSH